MKQQAIPYERCGVVLNLQVNGTLERMAESGMGQGIGGIFEVDARWTLFAKNCEYFAY
jgi:hypothetical protein